MTPQTRKFGSEKTTTAKGKREYQRKYMRELRAKKRVTEFMKYSEKLGLLSTDLKTQVLGMLLQEKTLFDQFERESKLLDQMMAYMKAPGGMHPTSKKDISWILQFLFFLHKQNKLFVEHEKEILQLVKHQEKEIHALKKKLKIKRC